MRREFSIHWRWELAAYITVAAIVLLAAFYSMSERNSAEWDSLNATVVRTGMRSDYNGNHPLLVVRLSNGSQQQILISASQHAQCNPGDTIVLMQQGLAYRVALEGCKKRRSVPLNAQ